MRINGIPTHQCFMDTLIYLTRLLLIFLLPLLVAALPLLTLLKLMNRPTVNNSAPLLLLSTAGSVLMGGITTFLAFMICSAGMAVGVETKGLCVIGALTFWLIGGFFTLTSLLVGLYQSVYRAVQHPA